MSYFSCLSITHDAKDEEEGVRLGLAFMISSFFGAEDAEDDEEDGEEDEEEEPEGADYDELVDFALDTFECNFIYDVKNPDGWS